MEKRRVVITGLGTVNPLEIDYAYIYRRKKVYERTDSKVISIG